ncbi:flavoprotein-like protein [Lentinula raphanica]|nr:flavoprotein-like protein [Lentinula raphanica]
MDAYSTEDLVSETLVIFIVSTTGSGSEPRTMTLFWKKLLLSSLPPNLLEDVHCTVFGLGDSAYEKFCWPAKRLTRRLESLGAVRVCECAEGDEQHILGIDEALEPWLRTLSNTLHKIIPLPPGTDIIPFDQVYPARVSLVTCSDAQATMADAPLNYDWYQDVRDIELDLDDSIDTSYRQCSEVEIFLAQMGWGNFADDVLEIKHVYEDQSLPDYLLRYSTVRTIFTHYEDFNAVPRRQWTKLKEPRRGVCSTYLAQLRAGEQFRMKITKGFIQLPVNDVPIICVGPSTGIAPMRTVIKERIQAKARGIRLHSPLLLDRY